MTPPDDMLSRYERMKRADLAKELRRRGVVDGWTVSYMTKKQLVTLLCRADRVKPGSGLVLPNEFVEILREKQRAHMEKTKRARRNRSEAFGIENLTRREALTHAFNTYPGLRYVGKRVFDKPFESFTGGAHDAKVASVFKDRDGREHFLTRAECKALSEKPFDVRMPKEAFQHAKKSVSAVARAKGKPTLGDVW